MIEVKKEKKGKGEKPYNNIYKCSAFKCSIKLSPGGVILISLFITSTKIQLEKKLNTLRIWEALNFYHESE